MGTSEPVEEDVRGRRLVHSPQPGRVWMVGDDGKPRSVAVQLGISDGTRSEVLAGPLTEQSHVIVSTGGPSDRNSRPGSEPRLRF